MGDLAKYKKLLSKEYADKISSYTDTFVKQDIDSLDRYSIILEISEALNIDIPEQEFSKLNSLEGIDKVLSEIKKN
jgi:acyl carrier protein